MRAVVFGSGAVGSRAARQLVSTAEVEHLVICDRANGRANGRVNGRAEAVAASLGPVARAAAWGPDALGGADVLVLATPDPLGVAREAVHRSVPVVSVADSADEVTELLGLDAAAREAGITVAVGAGMAPGLTCVLARYAAAHVGTVEEIHVSRAGTGGPACARQHHRCLGDESIDFRDGDWAQRRGGSGRELCWFPDPIGGLDCYRAGLADAMLLVPAFPGVVRVTARVAASRRDRLTSRLPMLRPPHPEGDIGAVRVEVRGRRAEGRQSEVLGVIDRPAVAAGAVAAVAALLAAQAKLARTGAGGLAELVVDPATFLADLNRRGVKAALFEGMKT